MAARCPTPGSSTWSARRARRLASCCASCGSPARPPRATPSVPRWWPPVTGCWLARPETTRRRPVAGRPSSLVPATPPAAEGAFGAAVAAAGSNPLVGAPGTGTVYLFRGGTGEPVLTLESPGGAGRFGSAIATVGANVLVGAPGTGGEPGEAFLFGGGTGRLQLTLTNPLPAAGDQFGFAVATAG